MDSSQIKSYLISIIQKTTAMPFRRQDGQYQCFYCYSTFITPRELSIHTKETHKNMDFYTCTRIWADFDLGSGLMLDIQNLRCKTCKKRMHDLESLKWHFYKEHEQVIPKDVLDCIVSFKLLDAAQSCFVCGAMFEYFEDLFEHQRTETHLKCQTCGDLCNDKTELIEHDKSYCRPCSICNLRFPSKEEREIHLDKTHLRDLKCDFCLQDFKITMTLRRHIRNIHYKEKNVTCDECGKTFFDICQLRLHLVVHSTEKPFQCSYCSAKFPRKISLQRHERIHTNDRRYECKICNKKFVQWVSLHHHHATHSEERKYQCPFCDKRYKDKKTMLLHSKKWHG